MATAGQTTHLPGDFDALVVVAQREHGARRLAEAVAAYRKILAIRPDIAEVHYNLGNVLVEQGQLDEAAAEYQQALAIRPDLFQAYNNLGNIRRDQGQLDQAVAAYEQALALRPDLADLHNNLGNILQTQGKLDQALVRFERALILRPEFGELHYNVGCILHGKGRLDEAVVCYKRAIAFRPELAVAYNNLGAVLKDQGELDQAVARYEQAIALRPNFAAAYNNLGNVLKQLGQFDRALACYDQALALGPVILEAHYHRADLKTFRAGDADLAVMESLVTDHGQARRGKIMHVHFALGKALEDVGDHERAFEQLLLGNALKRRELDYDGPAYHRAFQLAAEAFDSALLERFAGVGDPSAAPIFVLGMPRSGSTLVEQILASHPRVQAGGELMNLDPLLKSVAVVNGQPVPIACCVGQFDADKLRRLGHAYLAGLPALAEGKDRITDKAPGNFLHVGLIRLILPNARIIHTVRDPVDTCVSCFSKLFPSGQAFCYDLAELGRYYRWYHELMEHWRGVLPAGAMLDVSYENVVDDLERQARRLIDFCGLPWDDRCLSFHQHSRPIATASSVQVRRPVYRSSLARWRRYEVYLPPLLAELESCRPVGEVNKVEG
ncbi:MAG TPA: tetratricopeptide repeat protein [Pirellulales bacterium]|jgi:tetratricopeptide (TPR) repeat protein|nr:tetratricopeptide repeat protein [Pirellulales bacterium]